MALATISSAGISRRILAGLLALIVPLLAGNTGRLDHLAVRALDAHNRVRAEIGVPPLRWDPALASDAAAWADHLTKTGRLVHSTDDPANPDPEGENLWAGTKGYYSVETMVGLWAGEERNFTPGIFPLNSRTGRLEDVGHYTQMIWRSTTRVGCAIAPGKSDEFFVCRYAEGGNVLGEAPF